MVAQKKKGECDSVVLAALPQGIITRSSNATNTRSPPLAPPPPAAAAAATAAAASIASVIASSRSAARRRCTSRSASSHLFSYPPGTDSTYGVSTKIPKPYEGNALVHDDEKNHDDLELFVV